MPNVFSIEFKASELKKELMTKEGIPLSEVENYEVNSAGVLYPKKLTPAFLKQEIEETAAGKFEFQEKDVQAKVGLPNDEIALLKELVLLQRKQADYNAHLVNKVLNPKLEAMNAKAKDIHGWITFMGIMVLLGVIISILGSCMALGL